MKNVIKVLLGALVVVSCTVDPCKNVVCGTQGTCDAGICLCENGYEKDAAGLCNTEVRAKFLGAWTVSDACTSSGASAFNISASSNTSDIMGLRITNVWNQFTNFTTATVNGTSTFNIPRQAPDSDGFYVESIGDATISGNTITVTYVVTDERIPAAITSDTCTSTWTK